MFLAKTLSIRLNNDLESGHILLFEKRKKIQDKLFFIVVVIIFLLLLLFLDI